MEFYCTPQWVLAELRASSDTFCSVSHLSKYSATSLYFSVDNQSPFFCQANESPDDFMGSQFLHYSTSSPFLAISFFNRFCMVTDPFHQFV